MVKAVLFAVFVVLPAFFSPIIKINEIGKPCKPATQRDAVIAFVIQIAWVSIFTYLVWFAG